MINMQCPECKNRMVVDSEPMTFKINPNVIVQKVKISKCDKCGFSCVSEAEYEKIRKEVHEVKATKGAIVVIP